MAVMQSSSFNSTAFIPHCHHFLDTHPPQNTTSTSADPSTGHAYISGQSITAIRGIALGRARTRARVPPLMLDASRSRARALTSPSSPAFLRAYTLYIYLRCMRGRHKARIVTRANTLGAAAAGGIFSRLPKLPRLCTCNTTERKFFELRARPESFCFCFAVYRGRADAGPSARARVRRG